MTPADPVTVVFSSDDNHAMLLGVALCSLFENKKGDYPVRVFVLDGGISSKNRARLKTLEERYGFVITYIIPDPKLFEGISTEFRPTPAYYRVAIGRLLPSDCRRALYMDCDVVVRGDVVELFNIDLNGKTVAAATDQPGYFWTDYLKKMCDGLGLPEQPEYRYFNSGVLVMNLERWRACGIEAKLFEFIRANPDKLWVADQNPLNVVLLGDWQEIPARYNFMPPPTHTIDEKNPFIVHYAAGDKPWYLLSALGYHDDYVRYANMTPWKNVKYRKLMDVHFARKYHIYPVVWGIWSTYKKLKR